MMCEISTLINKIWNYDFPLCKVCKVCKVYFSTYDIFSIIDNYLLDVSSMGFFRVSNLKTNSSKSPKHFLGEMDSHPDSVVSDFRYHMNDPQQRTVIYCDLRMIYIRFLLYYISMYNIRVILHRFVPE